MTTLNQERPPALPAETPSSVGIESAAPPPPVQEERRYVSVKSLNSTGLNERAKSTIIIGGLAALVFYSIGMIPLAIAAMAFTAITGYQAWGKNDWQFDVNAITSGALLLMAGLTKKILPVVAASVISAINPLANHLKGAGLWIITLIVILLLLKLRH